MYSKYGKVIAERFQILNHREEILSGKVKKMKPPSTISTNLRFGSFDLFDPAILENSTYDPTEDLQEKSQTEDLGAHHKNRPKQSVAFSSQSREEFYKSTDKKSVAPACGHYDCKYSLVFKSVCVPTFKQRPRTKSKTSHKRVCSGKHESKEVKVSKETAREPFDQQLPRPSITKMSNDVNENRFIKFTDMPNTCSKYKRACTPNIKKSIGRKPLFVVKETSPDYNPSFRLVMEDLGKVTNFEKYSSRKEKNVKSYRDAREYNPNYALVEKRVCSPDFRKSSSRPTSASPLPSYMKSANWRGAINLINEKSLEMNYSIDKDSLYESIYL